MPPARQPRQSSRRPRPHATAALPSLRAGHPSLRGTSGERDRRARRRLVRELLLAGVPEAGVDQAIDEDRLALLPAELVLGGRRRFSEATLRRRSGLSRAEMADFARAAGLAEPPEITARHLDMAAALAEILDAGIELEAALEVARVAGQALAGIARAAVRVVAESYVRAGDTEYDVGARYADVATNLMPVLARLVDDQLRLHILAALREERLGQAERARGRISPQRDMAVAFADLVGFTRLGARVHSDEVGRVAARLVELASEAVQPPVHMVKTVGDAVMLVSPDPARLVEDVLALVASVAAEGEHYPELRAGVAYGPTVGAAGDWYGHTVNLASRLTSVARAGTVVATPEVRHMTRDRISWSRSLPRHLRGMHGAVFIVRARSVAPAAASASRDHR